MNELTIALRIALANAYVMYFKSHAYHWNVEGINFSQYHNFFSGIYEDVYGSIDELAENLRKLDAYAPFSLDNLFSFKTIQEDAVMPNTVQAMLNNLVVVNSQVIESLNKVFDLASANKDQGLADYVSGRIDTHKKHAWMLKASLKNLGA